MQASLNLDQWADASNISPELSKHLRWKFVKDRQGNPRQDPYFPAGTIFEGQQAVQLCRTGQATPADSECMEALGLSEGECQRLAVEYEMNTLGIWDKKDRELFRAGVIAGYEEDGTAKPGPNWDAYNAALEDTKTQGEI